MAPRVFAAVDLGASGGRVIAGLVGPGGVELCPVHRFANRPSTVEGHLRWDLSALYREVLMGLRRLVETYPELESIGIDTWGVDYGLLDGNGTLLAEPVSYRDRRGPAQAEAVHAVIARDELFSVNGLQLLPFTTLYQLAAERQGPLWEAAAHVVLLPDLLAYWLTGALRTEVTNASTTGLLDPMERQWSVQLLGRLGIPVERLPALEEPGWVRGRLHPEVAGLLGVDRPVVVTTVGSHDTASAVAGVPAATPAFAYVATGTWSLVGVELPRPDLGPDVAAAAFSNELGVDQRTRLLRNAPGTWLFEECLRTWAGEGRPQVLARLLEEASRIPPGTVVDVSDPELGVPGRVPGHLATLAAEQGCVLGRPVEVVRCIVDSLARSFADTLRTAIGLAPHPVDTVHVVGGASANGSLCQLTADGIGLPVLAGPTEATALGNVLVQARAHDALCGTLDDLRAHLSHQLPIRRFEPR